MEMMQLLTVADVAQILGVSPQRVRAIVKQRNACGGPIGRKVGRDWVFTPQEVELLRPGKPGRPPQA